MYIIRTAPRGRRVPVLPTIVPVLVTFVLVMLLGAVLAVHGYRYARDRQHAHRLRGAWIGQGFCGYVPPSPRSS